MKAILFITFASVVCFAAGKKTDVKTDEKKTQYQTMDLKQFDNVNKPAAKGSAITLEANCTGEDGKVYQADDMGYGACATDAQKNSKNQNK